MVEIGLISVPPAAVGLHLYFQLTHLSFPHQNMFRSFKENLYTKLIFFPVYIVYDSMSSINEKIILY